MPCPELQQIAREVLEEQSGKWLANVKVILGNLEAGVTAAKQAMNSGVEAIISQGGTAMLLSREVNVPVVEIKINVADVLRALSKVPTIHGSVAIMGFPNVISSSEKRLKLLGTSLQFIMLNEQSEAEEKVLAAAKKGVQVIVGDSISVQTAVRLGLQGILIEPDKEAVRQTLAEVWQIVGGYSKDPVQGEVLNTIIESSTDGIVCIDINAYIRIFNQMAEEIFQVSAADAIGQPVTAVIPNTRLPLVVARGLEESGDIQNVGNKVVATKRIPIKIDGEVVGAVAHFQDVTQLQHYEQDIRQKVYTKGLVAKTTINDIVGTSPALMAVKKRACQYGATSSTVLITGESGSGKEMFAQSIHNLSKRRSGPFVAVNCAALPENLLESELFGYDEGAFTGARKGGKTGLIELAHKGTLFLDEISEMHLVLQSRLLRVLQEKEVMRLGGERLVEIDVRFIAATNQNLNELVAKKLFRQDLYYRLDILRLQIPPLRERIADISSLAEFFIDKFCRKHGKKVSSTPGVIKLLTRYHWPGNVRELANILERAVLLAASDTVEESCIREALLLNSDLAQGELEELTSDSLSHLEQYTINRILAEEGFNYSKAATRLGINRSTLWRKLHKIK